MRLFIASLLFISNITITLAEDYDHYTKQLINAPIPSGVIVFERSQGMDETKSNYFEPEAYNLKYVNTRGVHLHYIGDRPGDILSYKPDNCEFRYIRVFHDRDRNEIGSSNSLLSDINNCDHFIYRVLARVKPGRKLYMKLGQVDGRIQIDKMYFEGQIIYENGRYITDSKLRSTVSENPQHWSEYARALYLGELQQAQRECE